MSSHSLGSAYIFFSVEMPVHNIFYGVYYFQITSSVLNVSFVIAHDKGNIWFFESFRLGIYT